MSSDTRKLIAVSAAIGALACKSIAWIYGADLTFHEQGPIRGDGAGTTSTFPRCF